MSNFVEFEKWDLDAKAGKTKLSPADSRMQYLLCNAMEGGSNYWASIAKYRYPEGVSKADVEFPHLEVPFLKGGSILIAADADSEPHKNPARKDGLWVLNYDALVKGWDVMKQKYPRHAADVIRENDDACTGDVYLQCCLFGEAIFG